MPRSDGCAIGSILLDGPDGQTKEGFVKRAGCGAWGCEDCGPLKQRVLHARLVVALLEKYEQECERLRRKGIDVREVWKIVKLITLTVDPKYFISRERAECREFQATPEEAEAARRALMVAWNNLHSYLRALKRRQKLFWPLAKWEGDGWAVPYFWVLEFTQNGWPHLHIILIWRKKFSPAQVNTIRRLWKESYRVGESVDLRNKNWRFPNPAALARYLAKYLAKGFHSLRQPSWFRRWSSSRRFLPSPVRWQWLGDGGFSRASVATHRQERRQAGATIQDLPGRDAFIWSQAWESSPADRASQALAAAVRLVSGNGARPSPVYSHPGLDFAQRLELRDGHVVNDHSSATLFIPDDMRHGITPSRPRCRNRGRKRRMA